MAIFNRDHKPRTGRIVGATACLALCTSLAAGAAFSQEDARDGGSITVHINRDIGGFDNIKVPQGGMGRFQVIWAVYDKLFEKDENGNIVPNIATEATANDDFTVWTVTLREEVKYSNGAPLTAASYEHHFDRLLGSGLADNFRGVLGGNLQKVVALDDLTIQFEFGESHPAFKSVMADGGMFPLSGVNELGFAMENEDKEDYNRMAVGTGPYMLKEWVPGEGVTLVRNPHYWNPEAQHLDEIFYRITEGPETGPIWNAFVAGDVDVMWSIDGSASSRAKDSDEYVYETGTRGQLMYTVNFQSNHEPLQDVRVRQALALAINREALATVIGKGMAPIAVQSFPPGDPWFCDGIAYPDYDPDKARALLADYGQEIPPIELWTQSVSAWQQTVEMIQAMWRDVGVDAEINLGGPGPTGVIFKVQNGETPTWMDVRGSVVHPSVYGLNLHSEHNGNLWRIESTEIDAAIANIKAATNDEEIKEAHCQFEQAKIDMMPYLPFMYAPAALVGHDYIGGITAPNDVVLGYHKLWLKE